MTEVAGAHGKTTEEHLPAQFAPFLTAPTLLTTMALEQTLVLGAKRITETAGVDGTASEEHFRPLFQLFP